MRSGQFGWDSNIDYFKSNTIFLIKPVPATTNYGVLNIGSGPFDGLSTGKFIGSANGTQIAVNAPSGYTGTFADLQLAGTSKLYLHNNGQIVANLFSINPTDNGGSITIHFLRLNSWISPRVLSGNSSVVLQFGDSVLHTQYISMQPDGANSSSYGKVTISTGTFSGSSTGTSLAVAEPSGFVGNLLDLQINSVSKFKVDSTGNATINTPSSLDAAISAAAIAAWGRLD